MHLHLSMLGRCGIGSATLADTSRATPVQGLCSCHAWDMCVWLCILILSGMRSLCPYARRSAL